MSRRSQTCAHEIAVFVDGVGLNGGVDEFCDELLLQVFNKDFLGTKLCCFGARCFKIFFLPDISLEAGSTREHLCVLKCYCPTK